MNFEFEKKDDVRSGDGIKTINWLISQISEGDVFIDCGAHIGFIAIPVILATNLSKIILIEPSRYAVRLLKRNLELNGIKDYEIINGLISDKVGYDYYKLNDNPAHGSMFIGERRYRRKTWTIDKIVEQYQINRPIVMKMDIELAEPLAWKGMIKYLSLIKAVNMEFMMSAMEQKTNFNPREFIKSIESKGLEIAPVDNLWREDYKWDLCITSK